MRRLTPPSILKVGLASCAGDGSVHGRVVLEIGCGSGHYARAIAPHTASYIALDVSESMLANARQRGAGIANLTFLHADAQAIPLPDDAVDLVFGTWAIGAIWPPEARERAMGEIHRVLKPGGEIWAVETSWHSEFMDLRGPEEQANDLQTVRWYESHGFRLVDEVESAFVFPSLAEAERVLGFMFEEKALRYLSNTRVLGCNMAPSSCTRRSTDDGRRPSWRFRRPRP